MSKFAKLKFVRKNNDGRGNYVVEVQAWDEISSVKAMANPDYRALGVGATLEEAKKEAASGVALEHIRFMTQYPR